MNRQPLIPHLRDINTDRVRVPAQVERRLSKILGRRVTITTTTELAHISIELLQIGVIHGIFNSIHLDNN